jgi:3-oxoacyl-[acyl-carrier-protein] synthase III
MLVTKIKGIQIIEICNAVPLNKSFINGKNYHVSTEEQTSSDLGFSAASSLLNHYNIAKDSFGFLLFGSQTPDYRSPITAAVLQARLGFEIDTICYDVNVGSNGFIKMIQLGASVLSNINKEYGLIIIGDTPSKLRDKEIDNNFPINDAATAILLKKSDDAKEIIFFNNSVGEKYNAVILEEGGFRQYKSDQPFDASNIENFVVKQDETKLFHFIQEIENEIIEHSKLSKNIILSNFLQNYLEPGTTNKGSVFGNASELPLKLANWDSSLEDIIIWSAGEGLAVYGLYMDYIPAFMPTIETDEVFLDYKVSHQM